MPKIGAAPALTGPGYVLRLPPDAVDVWAFETAVESAAGEAPGDAVCTLDTALRLWRGPAYADYAGGVGGGRVSPSRLA